MGNCCYSLFKKKGCDNYWDTCYNFYDLYCEDIDGQIIRFADFKFDPEIKAYLIVNVASAWGLTNSNYKQLVQLDR